jgi:predicted acyl esterase
LGDGYRNNTFRPFEQLQCEKELLIGPWSHMAPSTSLPGPHIDLVPEMISFFGRWLGDAPVEPRPPIRVFVRHSTKPEPDLAVVDGEWRYEETWPPARLTPTTLYDGRRRTLVTHPTPGRRLELVRGWPAVGAADGSTQRRRLVADDGLAGGRADRDPRSRRGEGHRDVGSAIAYLSVKLNDVWPDGTSAL